jgi:hypothetical protein
MLARRGSAVNLDFKFWARSSPLVAGWAIDDVGRVMQRAGDMWDLTSRSVTEHP